VPDPEDVFRRLPADDRRRLARFVERLERTSVEMMLTLAARPLDAGAHAASIDRADQAARDCLRTDAVAQVRADADEWVLRLYNSSTTQPGWYEANWGRPGTAGDRANLAASMGDALIALVVWDRLDEEDRDELLGPFATLLD
jgi:hypothetical protein